eukprot:Seg8951.1 transcript_id=Seg8951.1/GoldUCD/mRNA.D3Y31 product="Molybdenum cofactor sulfurase" protein_id=Seg8951.1/GoldUCD/D3Y31
MSASQQRLLEGKELFLREYKSLYGYGGTIDSWRKEQFSRLQDTYLDHVGATLYSQSQIENHINDLQRSVFGNPHSANTSSLLSSDLIEEARNIVAKHFNTTLDNHHVIFTAGATSALKLVADNFNWTEKSSFIFLEDSHTSVVGMREVAKKEGSNVKCVTEDEVSENLEKPSSKNSEIGDGHKRGSLPYGSQMFTESAEVEQNPEQVSHLFSYPAMSNFCGRKYPHKWVDLVNHGYMSNCAKVNGKCYTLLDAASYVGTNHLDLSQVTADFIVMSFYKIFGFPTGLGALIVRTDAVQAFKQKCYYGGGTVAATISRIDHHVDRDGFIERYEDGTASFLSIIALKHGFSTLKSLTGSMRAITKHTFALAQFTYKEMKSFKHANGFSLCEIYSDTKFDDMTTQGPVVNFNLINCHGEYIGYSQVEKLANLSKIHLRTGCFCNTGDCRRHLGLSTEEMLSNYKAGHVCGDQMDIINRRPTGSVRVSFGYMSTFEDAWMFLNFLRECFLVSTNTILIKSDDLYVTEDGKKNSFEQLSTNCQANMNGTDLGVEANRDARPINERRSGRTINELTAKQDRFDGEVEVFEDSVEVKENIREMNERSGMKVFGKDFDGYNLEFRETNLRQKESQNAKELEVNYSSDEEFFDCASGTLEHFPVTNNLQVSTNITDDTMSNGSCFKCPEEEKAITERINSKENDTDNCANSKIDSLDQKIDMHCFENADQRSSMLGGEGRNGSCSDIKNNNLILEGDKAEYSGCYLKLICLYPVKSCAAFEVSRWMLSEKGLLYDREWMIVSEYGSVLTQKKEPAMVFIKPFIDLKENLLVLRCKGHADVAVPLDYDASAKIQAYDRKKCLSRVCGDRITCDDCGDEVAVWLSSVLQKSCRLVRQNGHQMRIMKATKNEFQQIGKDSN